MIASLLLGGILLFALARNGEISLRRLTSKTEAGPQEVERVTATEEIIDPAALKDLEADFSPPVPTGSVIQEGPTKEEDIEDVLLLYSSANPGNFDTNFCHLADFLGLKCKRIDLDGDDLIEKDFKDPAGEYYRLVGINGDNLLRRRISKELRDILRGLIEHEGVDLLISDISQYRNPQVLEEITDGLVTGFSMPEDSYRDWSVSGEAAEVTKELTNQYFSYEASAPQRDLSLDLADDPRVVSLIRSETDEGDPYTLFAKLQIGAGSIFVDAGELANSLDDLPFREMLFRVFNFGKITPVFITMKYVMGEEAWHRDENYANLTLDRLALRTDNTGLDYAGLAEQMKVHDFHTTIGFVPIHWDNSDLDVVRVIRSNPSLFSIVQVGNNHDGYEFYLYDLPLGANDTNSARPLTDQEADILDGLARMDRFQGRTGISPDRIMIFPQGISPEGTLVLLKKYNYLASVNTQHVPLDREKPEYWDYGMSPAFMDYGSFPISDRWHPGDYDPFVPDIQTFILDLFVDKPALFYSQASLLFSEGIDAFNPVAEMVDQVEGGVTWLGLGDIFRHLYSERLNDDGSYDVMFFTNHVILENKTGQDRTVHALKEETQNLPISSLTLNGHEFPYRVEEGMLRLDALIPAGETYEIVIRYGDWGD